MPELPEVETTCRGIRPHLLDRRVTAVVVRERRLRWPVPEALEQRMPRARIRSVERRAKYLLVGTDAGTLILHLGMSGSLRVNPSATPAGRHDHLDIVLDNGKVLRFHDPRRFGSALWTQGDPLEHPLLSRLGPEPLGDAFTGAHLHRCSRGRRTSVKAFVMDATVVVGVGNIYASEALFTSGIHPLRAAGRIALPRYERLAEAVRTTLVQAIEAGGTTLRDFLGVDGEPGYFSQVLAAYGRAGLPCPRCGTPIARRVIAQRASYLCPRCQR